MTTHRRARSITSLVRRQKSSGPTVLSILASTYQVRWRTVEERLATHPSEATQLDSGGCSVLYRALVRRIDDYPPYPIVRSILRAYPKAIWERHNKTTLLEIACSRLASLETLELLTKSRPAIPEDASAVCALWQSYCRRYGDEDSFVDFLESETPEAFHIGCKFQLLLRYLTTEQLLPCKLHIAASSKHCSLDLFKLFYQIFPEQIRHSSEGRLPLHHALSGATDSINQTSKARYLIDETPESVYCRDANGRLPLHLALEAGLVDEPNLEKWLGRKTQDTLTVQDPVNGFFPFQIAALSSSNSSVLTIYQLLRPVPQLVRPPTSQSWRHLKKTKR